jgi:hypothetical protein
MPRYKDTRRGPRLSPAPKPVTQINRLTCASFIAVTSTRVVLEKNRVGLRMNGRTPPVLRGVKTEAMQRDDQLRAKMPALDSWR